MRQKQNFTNPVISNSTYAGEAASGYIAAALFSARTLDNKYITIMPNVKFKRIASKRSIM